MDTLALTQDAYNAHLLGAVIDATAPPGETASAKQIRAAVIVEMFRAFEAANAMQAMIACHCVTLQFLLTAAMRDACDITLDPLVLARMRASAMTISKTLHLWMTKYEKIQARDEARAAEAKTNQPAPAPVAAQRQQDQPRPVPAKSPAANIPRIAPFLQAGPAPPSTKDALLSSAAILHGIAPNGGVSPNGRLTVPAPARGT